MSSFAPVIALARGLETLRVINSERRSTVGSLHKSTGLDKATIVRMLETLEHEGYVMRCEEPTVYVPTGRSLLLSQGYDKYLWIGRVAEPLLNEFRKKIQWPSDISVIDDDAMIVAHTTRERGSLLFSRPPGFRFPLLGTSMGRAYLAFCGDSERERLISRLAANPEPWNDLARNRRKFNKVMANTRETGFALMEEEYSRQVFAGTVWAFGVPVMIGSTVFASMNVMLLRKAVPQEDGISQFLAPMQRAAAEIADALTNNLDARASLHVADLGKSRQPKSSKAAVRK